MHASEKSPLLRAFILRATAHGYFRLVGILADQQRFLGPHSYRIQCGDVLSFLILCASDGYAARVNRTSGDDFGTRAEILHNPGILELGQSGHGIFRGFIAILAGLLAADAANINIDDFGGSTQLPLQHFVGQRRHGRFPNRQCDVLAESSLVDRFGRALQKPAPDPTGDPVGVTQSPAAGKIVHRSGFHAALKRGFHAGHRTRQISRTAGALKHAVHLIRRCLIERLFTQRIDG